MSGAYLGMDGGLDYFDTPHGPMGVTPEIGAQMRGNLGMAADSGTMVPPPPVQSAPAPFAARPPPINGPTTWAGAGMADPNAGGPAPGANGQDFNVATGLPPTAQEAARMAPAPSKPSKAPRGASAAAPAGPGAPSLESAYAQGTAAMDQREGAVVDQTNLAAQDAEAENKIAQDWETRRQQINIAEEQRKAADDAHLAKFQGAVATMVDKQAGMQVDRGQYWSSKSGMNKALTGISVALAGIGSAMKHQGDKNPALDLVMAGIQENVNDQVSAIAKAGDDVKLRQGELQNYRQSMQDKDAAYNATMAHGIAEVEMQVKAAMAKTGSARAIANGQVMLADLATKRAEYEGASAKGLFDRDMESRKQKETERSNRSQEGAAWAGIELRKQEMANHKDEAVKAALAAGDAARAQRIGEAGVADLKTNTGDVYIARDAKAAADVSDRFAATQTVVGLIDSLREIKSKYPNEAAMFASPEYRKLESTGASLMLGLNKAAKAGALDAGALTVMKQQMGLRDDEDLSGGSISQLAKGYMRSTTSSALETLRKNQIDDFNNSARANRSALGGEYVDWLPPDPKGWSEEKSTAAAQESASAIEGMAGNDRDRYGGDKAYQGRIADQKNRASRGLIEDTYNGTAIFPDQSVGLDGLLFGAQNGDETAKPQLEALAKSKDLALAAGAAKRLERLGGYSNYTAPAPYDGPQSYSSQSTARDEPYPPAKTGRGAR